MEIELKKEDWGNDESDGIFYKYVKEMKCPKCGAELIVRAGLLEKVNKHYCHNCFEHFEISTVC